MFNTKTTERDSEVELNELKKGFLRDKWGDT